jgi:chemotaxis protein MotB
MMDDIWQTPGDAPRDRWLLSYADLVTLLLAFFVVMYSVSAVNDEKLSELASTLSASFDPATTLKVDPVADPAVLLTNLQLIVKDEIQVSHSSAAEPLTIVLPGELLFSSGSGELSERGMAELENLLPTLKLASGTIQIEGHTDNQPISTIKFPSNWELSAHRAASVARYLEEQGVTASLTAVGLADTHGAATNATEEGRRQNRRVVLQVSELDWEALADVLEATAAKQAAIEKNASLPENPADDIDLDKIDPALLEQVLNEIEAEGN